MQRFKEEPVKLRHQKTLESVLHVVVTLACFTNCSLPKKGAPNSRRNGGFKFPFACGAQVERI